MVIPESEEAGVSFISELLLLMRRVRLLKSDVALQTGLLCLCRPTPNEEYPWVMMMILNGGNITGLCPPQDLLLGSDTVSVPCSGKL